MSDKQPDYWPTGWYRLFADVYHSPDELRPGLVTIKATVNVGSSIIGQILLGQSYLGRFKLAQKERVITVKFDQPIRGFRLHNFDADYVMAYKAGYFDQNVVRDLYADGTVNVRLRQVSIKPQQELQNEPNSTS